MSVRAIGWLAGLPCLAALWVGAMHHAEVGLDAALTAPAEALAAATSGEAGEPWLRVERRGRDFVAQGDAPSAAEREAALDRLREIPGARRIVDRLDIVAEQTPFVWTAHRRSEERIDLRGYRPAEVKRADLSGRLAPLLPDTVALHDAARAARGAPSGFAEAAAFLMSQVARLAPGATAGLQDHTLTLEGEAATVEDYEAVRAALASLPAGFDLGAVSLAPAVVQPFAWSATRRPDGSIRLDGYTVSEADRAAILAAARRLSNGAPVEDAMRTARGLPAGIESRALIERAFAALALVRDGAVALDGATLSVRGAAIDAQAVREADALTTGSLPEGLSPGRVDLTASPVQPYRVGIRRDAEAVTLTGHLPDAETRAALLAALRPQFFGERIVDRTRLSDGAPAGLLAVLRAASVPLGQLARVEVTVTDQVLRLTGESLYAESARRLTASGERLVPAGWRAEVSVRAKDEAPAFDAATCRTAFAERIEPRTVRFAPGSADLQADFYPTLDDLATLARTCPGARIEVAGHDDPPGTVPPAKPPAPKPSAPKPAKSAKGKAKAEPVPEPEMPDVTLPQRRAAAIVDYLLKAGVPADRVAAVSGDAQRRAVAFALRS
ncbi:OmpA family protein [Methylobacterium nodulans]|uniref:OmpA/MotB domain protein n=1 Tax=Methylobacterium nodulans (strain LMG 21967 / CNCM I-2342 / ORS 2060) TaxID=460265 RepID=B8INE6_METNO|nr:OmpA family protein [Methylobacterium nodulans]ACL56472.1 OmpA/MotB domain protein [Methylobacterium nodulans ORS 2060]